MAALDDLIDLWSRSERVVVLSGAGTSTDSGIPDYRGPGSVPRRPMTAQEFRSGPEARRHYWARTYVGFARMGRAGLGFDDELAGGILLKPGDTVAESRGDSV